MVPCRCLRKKRADANASMRSSKENGSMDQISILVDELKKCCATTEEASLNPAAAPPQDIREFIQTSPSVSPPVSPLKNSRGNAMLILLCVGILAAVLIGLYLWKKRNQNPTQQAAPTTNQTTARPNLPDPIPPKQEKRVRFSDPIEQQAEQSVIPEVMPIMIEES